MYTGKIIDIIYERLAVHGLIILKVRLLFVMRTTGYLKYYFMIILTEKQTIGKTYFKIQKKQK
jgi:hypothetical protein